MPDPSPPAPAPAPRAITIRSREGTLTTTSDPAVIADLLRRGGAVESATEGAERAADEARTERYQGAAQTARTVIEGLGRGATFGATDVAARLLGNEYDVADRSGRRKANPIAAGVSEGAGALAPALLSGGTGAAGVAARLTPAGRLSAGAARVAEGGGVARAALGGAIEGAAQNAGTYVSDVALGDRDLTAEGVVGALGTGALAGGGIGGGLAVTGKGLMAAKRLFPESAGAAGREAAERSSREVADALDRALGDAQNAENQLTARAANARAAREAVDPQAAARAAEARRTAETADALGRAQLDELAAPGTPRPARSPAGAGAVAQAPRTTDTLDALARAELDDLAPAPPIPRGRDPRSAVAASVDDLEAQLAATRDAVSREGSLLARAAGTAPAKAGKRRIAGELQDERIADPFHGTGRRVRSIPDEDLEALSSADLLAAARGDIRAGAPARGTKATKASKATTEAATPAADSIEDQLAATLASMQSGKSIAELAAPTVASSQAAAAARRATRSAASDAAGAASNARAAQSLEDAAARARRVEDAVDEAVGDAASIEAKAAARELRAARRELEEVVGAAAARPPTGPLTLPPLAAKAAQDAGADAVDAMRRALRGGSDDVGAEVARAIPAFQRFEAAQVRAAEVLGDIAPPGLKAAADDIASSAAAHRQAVTQAEVDAGITIGRERAGDLAQAMARAGKAEAQAAGNLAYPARPGLSVLDDAGGAASGKSGRALDFAAALDLLSETGIPGLPSAASIPVIGPMLSLYLKARAASRVFGKFGGKLPATVEARAAKASAQMRDRVNKSVRGLLDASSKTATRAAIPAASIAVTLARPLLGGKAREETEPTAAWKKTSAEIDKLSNPVALEAAVRAAVPTSDPGLARALQTVAGRKVAFLASKLPRPPVDLQSPFSRLVDDWKPSRNELAAFARYKEAVDDPAGVLERAVAGQVSLEGVEALRTVYPRQYQEARTQLLLLAMEHGQELPRGRREMLSTLFDIPLDPTQIPTYVASMQANFEAPPPAPPPQPAMPAQPQPAITRPTKFAARAALPGDE